MNLLRANPPSWRRWLIAGVSLAFFVKACQLPAIWVSNMAAGEPGVATGLGALLFAWTKTPRALLPWSANFFWLASGVLLLVGAVRSAGLSAIVAVALGLSAFLLYPRSVLLAGYSWWLASMATIATGSMGAWLWRRRAFRVAHRAEPRDSV
jgi:hypothetical protein